MASGGQKPVLFRERGIRRNSLDALGQQFYPRSVRLKHTPFQSSVTLHDQCRPIQLVPGRGAMAGSILD